MSDESLLAGVNQARVDQHVAASTDHARVLAGFYTELKSKHLPDELASSLTEAYFDILFSLREEE